MPKKLFGELLQLNSKQKNLQVFPSCTIKLGI
jgi:hypothetical protein